MMSDASRPAKRARTSRSTKTAPPSRTSKTISPLSFPSHANWRPVPSALAPHAPTADSPPRPARSTTTSSAAPSADDAPPQEQHDDRDDEDEQDLPLSYIPRRDIPPIHPTPSADCPLGPDTRATLLSRRYDLASGQPLYRVRVEHLRRRLRSSSQRDGSRTPEPPCAHHHHRRRSVTPPPPNGETSSGKGIHTQSERRGHGSAEQDAEDDVERTEELAVWLSDVLSYVSPAELERFELEFEEDVMMMVDDDGAVLLVSKEVQQEMMGWGGEKGLAAAAASGPSDAPRVSVSQVKMIKRRKAPTKEFVDMLPPVRRRGRPKKVKTAEFMGVARDGEGNGNADDTGAEGPLATAPDTPSETHEYGVWVDPASVRGMAPLEGTRDDRGERDELALSEDSGGQLGLWRAGGVLKSTEQPSTTDLSLRRSARSRTTSRAPSYAHTADQHDKRSRRKKQDPHRAGILSREASVISTASSRMRDSTSSSGARLRRSSLSRESTKEFFHSATYQRRSTQSSVAESQPDSEASDEDGVADILSAFGSTQSSRRKGVAGKSSLHDPDATPRASQQSISTKSRKAKNSKCRTSTTSALHQSSTMLHPPAEGASWEPEVPEVEEQEYEVESIVRHKHFAGDTYYLVKWADWPPDNESWFTAEELEGAREVLDEYLEAVRRRKQKGKGKARMVEESHSGRSGSEDESGEADSLG